MKTITQIIHFDASPSQVYEALIDPQQHATFTGAKAVIFPKVDGRFEVYGGYAAGTFTKLEPGAVIESTWKELAPEWPAGHYSRVKYELEADGAGTKLRFTQTSVPNDRYDEIARGWQDYYWSPLARYLANEKAGG